MTDNDEESDMLEWAKEYARNNNLILNPDKKQLATIIRGLVRNRSRFGRQYCPCRLRSGNEERDRAIECPCIYHMDEIAQEGCCHCNLFFTKA